MGFASFIAIALLVVVIVVLSMIWIKLQSVPSWTTQDPQETSDIIHSVMRDVAQTSAVVHQLNLTPTKSNLVYSLQLLASSAGKMSALSYQYPRHVIREHSRMQDPDQIIDMIEHQQQHTLNWLISQDAEFSSLTTPQTNTAPTTNAT